MINQRHCCCFLFLLALMGPVSAVEFPAREWPVATPESQGMSSAGLDKAEAYAQKYGGASGCVIRHGYLVKEWGPVDALADIKSATKGAFGATVLGLAINDGLVKLDDQAVHHFPALGAGQPEAVHDWLAEITIRELATMTAGFDDARPAKLVYRPGTKGIYSNDTANILADTLTLRFRKDLKDVVKRRILDPIGVPPSEWRWRDNAYRPKTIDGLKTREFASGITITHRALARIGYLYLRDGMWDGDRILSASYIRAATQPTDLPAPYPYYAFYWGSNAKGILPGLPRDLYWALGLGDSILAVCPSLDLVVVRLGTGSTKSQMPPFTDAWEEKVGGLFKQVADAITAPAPRSPVIKGVTWSPLESIVRAARDSDNWPMTWADDGHLYTAYGDGTGFDPKVPEKLSLGLARVEGGPEAFHGFNIRSPSGERKGDGHAGWKASGLLMVDGELYMLVRNAGNARLAWSSDHARTWQVNDWAFTTSFGCPTFLNFGKNYAGARDDYVYLYSHDSDSAYALADALVLARVPKSRVRDRSAYEFFEHRDEQGAPVWTADITKRGAVFENPGACYRSSVSYDAGLKRYLLCQTGSDASVRASFGIYDAPEPWGPWSTVFQTKSWDTNPGESCALPTKWMSADGKTLHLVFSGSDSFSVRKLLFNVAGE